jgi:serine/threonine protein kinase/tetratricopeptide (TPR) repeat protein
LTPDRLGRYRIVRKLGQGGMGLVYEARDEQLDRPVAIKTLFSSGADEESRKRLWREARAAARVRHPNVCQIFEVGEDSGKLFIVMELLEGQSLDERLKTGALPLRQAVPIALQMLSALVALHTENLVHRDLKPSNIFLTPHGVKLLDFGLAKSNSPRPMGEEGQTISQVSLEGAIAGTPQYMAPEQFQGKPLDLRTDLFAAGLVLFEMLAGSKPFKGHSVFELSHAVLYENPPALDGSMAVVAADRVVRRALAKSPDARYATATAMAEDLQKAVSESDSGEIPSANRVTRLMVLPFRILRPDPDSDFLAFSVPDAVAGSLSGLGSLVIRSTAAASRYLTDPLDFKRIAQEAEVDVALTGTILRAGQAIRVNCQLVEVPAGTLLWSHQPQVALSDLFQLQDDLVERIVESLSASLCLTPVEQRLLKHDVPANPAGYEFFLRANELSRRGLAGADQLRVARDLYLRCLEVDPAYAPAWAKLGKCYLLIGKGIENAAQNFALAESAFRRALELNPDLPLAHSLYAQLEAEDGRAKDAIARLLVRARKATAQPEPFVALVQCCRYSGLLSASVAAHERAASLDPQISTSVGHTFYQLGEYDRAHSHVTGGSWMLDAMSLDSLGRGEEALLILRTREKSGIPAPMRAVVCAWRAMLEGNLEESLEAAEQAAFQFIDPEGIFYMALVMARLGDHDRALDTLAKSLDKGFASPFVLIHHPWLESLRSGSRFAEILRAVDSRSREAVAAFRDLGGPKLLGVDPSPPPILE